MLEQAQNRRLLVDSDSDEEPVKPHVKPEGKMNPTDILQEVSGGRGSSPSPNLLSRAPCCLLCPCSVQCWSLMPRLSSSKSLYPRALGWKGTGISW